WPRSPSGWRTPPRYRIASARTPLEDDEHRQVLVGAEAMIGSGRHEDRVALAELERLALDVEHSRALEHDVDLVVGVRLLAVRLRGDEDVDADLEAGRVVDDLVAAAGLGEAALDALDVEGFRDRQRRASAVLVGDVRHRD